MNLGCILSAENIKDSCQKELFIPPCLIQLSVYIVAYIFNSLASFGSQWNKSERTFRVNLRIDWKMICLILVSVPPSPDLGPVRGFTLVLSRTVSSPHEICNGHVRHFLWLMVKCNIGITHFSSHSSPVSLCRPQQGPRGSFLDDDSECWEWTLFFWKGWFVMSTVCHCAL